MAFNRFAKGKRRVPGEMNKLEADYAKALELRKHGGEVIWYAFEAIKFKLAPSTFYTPDFILMLSDASLEIHEVKGFWEDDARVKIKVAASLFPFQFRAIQKIKGQWQEELF